MDKDHAWIEKNKGNRPFAAGALAYVTGRDDGYGCHYGMRSTNDWARYEFRKGWAEAQRDCRLALVNLGAIEVHLGKP